MLAVRLSEQDDFLANFPNWDFQHSPPELAAMRGCGYTTMQLESDVWSIASIVYNIYMGYPAFYQETERETLKKIMSCEWLEQDCGLLVKPGGGEPKASECLI